MLLVSKQVRHQQSCTLYSFEGQQYLEVMNAHKLREWLLF